MLPCLLFSKVSERVDLSTLLRYWAVPLSALVFVSGGLLFGFAAAKALRYPPHFFKPGIAAGTFGNISFIPIPLVAAMTMASRSSLPTAIRRRRESPIFRSS
jgi:predicted permease